jgi:transposase-like protein
MPGFDNFAKTEKVICGIKIIHMIRKGQIEKLNLSFLRLSLRTKLIIFLYFGIY